MKVIILIVFVLSYCAVSVAQKHDFVLSPIIYTRIHNNQNPVVSSAAKGLLVNSFGVGLNLTYKRIPFSITLTRDYSSELVAYHESLDSFYIPFSITQTWAENHIMLYYRMKQIDIGVGYNFLRRENNNNFYYGDLVVKDYHGLWLAMSRSFQWLDIEFRTKITLTPTFAALGWSQHSIVLSYKLGNTEREIRQTYQDSKDKNFVYRFILGGRCFPITNLRILENEDFGKVGIAPSLGLEVLWKKYGLSLNVDKDIWISLNGGSIKRDIKGMITSNFAGIKYHKLFKNNRNIRLGIGYSYIRDLDKIGLLTVDSPYINKGFSNFQVKGIAGTVSYEILKNTDIEIKHTFPIKSMGEDIFNPLRFSIGILWRHNPWSE